MKILLFSFFVLSLGCASSVKNHQKPQTNTRDISSIKNYKCQLNRSALDQMNKTVNKKNFTNSLVVFFNANQKVEDACVQASFYDKSGLYPVGELSSAVELTSLFTPIHGKKIGGGLFVRLSDANADDLFIKGWTIEAHTLLKYSVENWNQHFAILVLNSQNPIGREIFSQSSPTVTSVFDENQTFIVDREKGLLYQVKSFSLIE